MKKIIFVLGIMILVASCDKIEGPYVKKSEKKDVDVEFPALDTNKVIKKILFEEYTGHQCPNCPDGQIVLEQLVGLYGDSIIPISIHAGYFAQLGDAPFDYDFNTTTGTQLYNDYSINFNPLAIINRESEPLDKSQWQDKVAECSLDKIAGIQIINQYKNPQYQINTRTTMLRNYSGPVVLALYLVEDNIVKPQQYGGNVITEYVHSHVLRSGINGTYGERVTPDGLMQKDSAYTYAYRFSCEGHDWNPENCSVIAILMDEASKKVLQVEKAKLIQLDR